MCVPLQVGLIADEDQAQAREPSVAPDRQLQDISNRPGRLAVSVAPGADPGLTCGSPLPEYGKGQGSKGSAKAAAPASAGEAAAAATVAAAAAPSAGADATAAAAAAAAAAQGGADPELGLQDHGEKGKGLAVDKDSDSDMKDSDVKEPTVHVQELMDELEELKRDIMAGINDTQLQILSVVGSGAFGTV